jgi:ParB family chromosome partitioning protein
VKSQKLGRGLDALFGEIEEAYNNEGSNHDKIHEIPLKEIAPNPFQPRKSFDENTLQELAQSIKTDGLLQPIVVTQTDDGYQLIAGERRLRASKIAKLKEIKAIIIDADEDQIRQFALLENIQREELNSVELAKAYNELLKVHNITHDELSTMIHKSRTHITNTIRLLQLSEKTLKALSEQKISAGHAKVLVGLSDKQQDIIVNSIIGQKLSVREVEAMVKSLKQNPQESEEKIPHKIAYDFTPLKSKLQNFEIKYKISQNKLTFEFQSEEEIETFLAHFH